MKRPRCLIACIGTTCLLRTDVVVRQNSLVESFTPPRIRQRPLVQPLYGSPLEKSESVQNEPRNAIRKLNTLQEIETYSIQLAKLQQDECSRICAVWNDLTLEVQAAVLKRLTQLLLDKDLVESELHRAQPMIADLIQQISRSVSKRKFATADTDLNALAEVLISLSRLSGRGFLFSDIEIIAETTWKQLVADIPKATKTLGSKAIFRTLVAASLFGWLNDSFSGKHKTNALQFYNSACERLTQSDALGKLSASEMIQLLSVLANKRKGRTVIYFSREEANLIKAFSRRLRKQSVRSGVDAQLLSGVARAAGVLYRHADASTGKEISIMAYTVIKDLLRRCRAENVNPLLNSRECAQLCRVATEMAFDSHDILVDDLIEYCARVEILENASLRDLETVAYSVIYWRKSNPVFASKVANRFRQLVEISGPGGLNPLDVNQILRSLVLSTMGDDTLDSIRETIRDLLRSKDFLERCSIMELSNFAWFAYKTRLYDEELTLQLADRILDPDMAQTCTPKFASRTLLAFTNLFSLNPPSLDGSKRSAVLTNLFKTLGEHLLTSQLSQLDVSAGINAYAKASYFQDIGIFDHLVAVMVSRVNEFDVRQVAQSLWACGKMYMFENEGSGGSESTQYEYQTSGERPPYYSGAIALSSYLADKAVELSPKDVAQALWAIGRLQLKNEATIGPLAQRAQALSHEMNARELANILWALGRVNTKEFAVVYVLTKRVADARELELTTQEASNVLYALARLDIREEKLFLRLSKFLLENIHMASAQAIANVLWAHRAVHLSPPQELIDSWAHKKLGIRPVRSGTVDLPERTT